MIKMEFCKKCKNLLLGEKKNEKYGWYCRKCNEFFIDDKAEGNIINIEFEKGDEEISFLDSEELESEKLENYYKLNKELRKWQLNCFNTWKGSGCQGIIKVATGAGKTIFALKCIEYLKEKSQDLKIAIIVPTKSLMGQWEEKIKKELNPPLRKVDCFYEGKKSSFYDKDIIIFIINSAIKLRGLEELSKADFLIVDECHHAPSEQNRQIFLKKFKFTLGLSATPERKYEDYSKVLKRGLGRIIYEYDLKKAIEDGIISTFDLNIAPVKFTTNEYFDYNDLTTEIGRLFGKLNNRGYYNRFRFGDENTSLREIERLAKNGNKWARILLSKLWKRRSLLYNAMLKPNLIKKIVKEENGKIIIFSETIEFANNAGDLISSFENKVGIYHSNMINRDETLTKYRNGKIRVLVTVKALDEGLDVPDTDVGIIAASTRSERQQIQRLGRILRKRPKKHAKIYILYVQGIEDDDINRKLEGIKKAASSVSVIKY